MRRDATNKCGCFGILADYNDTQTRELRGCIRRTNVCDLWQVFLVHSTRETTTTVSKFGLMNDVARRQSRVGEREEEIHETYILRVTLRIIVEYSNNSKARYAQMRSTTTTTH